MTSSLDKLLQKTKERQLEAIHLQLKVKEYKKRIEAGNFNPKIIWEVDSSKMNFAELNTKTIARVLKKLPFDYKVVTLNLEKVIMRHTSSPHKLFPTNNLWKIRDPQNTARLIEFIEEGNKIIPPIIRVFPNRTLAIIDGHYRIALCRYLGLKQIPFLVRNKYLPYTDGLV